LLLLRLLLLRLLLLRLLFTSRLPPPAAHDSLPQ
jgi:hypothetical protein